MHDVQLRAHGSGDALRPAQRSHAVVGAIHTNDGSMNMKTPTGSMVTSVFTSSDPVDKIVDFYKSKLGDQASIVQTGNGTMLSGGEKDKNSVMITITPQANLSKIVIIHITNNP